MSLQQIEPPCQTQKRPGEGVLVGPSGLRKPLPIVTAGNCAFGLGYCEDARICHSDGCQQGGG